MTLSRILVLAAAFSLLAIPSADTGASEVPFSFCSYDDRACQSFVGVLPEGVKRVIPRPNGERYVYTISNRTVVLDEFQAWRWMRCVAYVAWAEGRDQGAAGMSAIAWVVANRAAARPIPDPCAVVAERSQFESMFLAKSRRWLKAARRGAMPPDITANNAPDRKAARVAKAVAWQLLVGTMRSDPTGGATHFIALDTQRRLGRAVPAWVSALQRTHVEGDHSFYRVAPRA